MDYPFAIVEMQIGPDGKETGTLSEFTKVRAYKDNIISRILPAPR